jgi:hypothetical protein
MKRVPPNREAYFDLVKRLKKRYSQKVCLAPYPDHVSNIVSAHTLSVGAMLRPISRKGNVYHWKSDMFADYRESLIELKLNGLKNVSTFNGFCEKHDRELFSSIENEIFLCKYNQLFLYAYRAVAKEFYLKRKQLDSFPKIEEIAKVKNWNNSDEYEYSDEAILHYYGILKGVEEIEQFKEKLDLILLNGEFRRIITWIFPFNKSPGLVCNSVYAPDFDFKGNYLQLFEDFGNNLNNLMVTILPYHSGGFALFSYLDTCAEGPAELIDSLLSEADFTSAIVWLVTCYFENIAFSPDWLESLSEDTQNIIRNRFKRNFLFNDKNNITLLKDNPLDLDDWEFGEPFKV